MSDLNEDGKDFTNFITIEKMTIRGLSRMMKKHFNLKREPLFISTTDKWNVINHLRKQKDQRTEFPFMTFKLVSMEVNGQSYHAKSLDRNGVVGAPNDAQSGMYKTQPIPVNINIEMSFLTDDLYVLLNFANNWLYVSLRKLLNMSIEFDGVNYDIQCETDTSLSIPEKDMQIEQVNAYEFVSQVIVHGYVSPAIPLDKFPKVYPFTGDVTMGFGLPNEIQNTRPNPNTPSSQDPANTIVISGNKRIPIYDPNDSSQAAEILGYEQMRFRFTDAGNANQVDEGN